MNYTDKSSNPFLANTRTNLQDSLLAEILAKISRIESRLDSIDDKLSHVSPGLPKSSNPGSSDSKDSTLTTNISYDSILNLSMNNITKPSIKSDINLSEEANKFNGMLFGKPISVIKKPIDISLNTVHAQSKDNKEKEFENIDVNKESTENVVLEGEQNSVNQDNKVNEFENIDVNEESTENVVLEGEQSSVNPLSNMFSEKEYDVNFQMFKCPDPKGHQFLKCSVVKNSENICAANDHTYIAKTNCSYYCKTCNTTCCFRCLPIGKKLKNIVCKNDSAHDMKLVYLSSDDIKHVIEH